MVGYVEEFEDENRMRLTTEETQQLFWSVFKLTFDGDSSTVSNMTSIQSQQ